ncbi:hypothetical protein D7D26_10635 [Pyramidobacter sp. CG50-2]|nr:hypothetical protein D7D26_10635 [Pyramidobacter sp. CG50-2]
MPPEAPVGTGHTTGTVQRDVRHSRTAVETAGAKSSGARTGASRKRAPGEELFPWEKPSCRG